MTQKTDKWDWKYEWVRLKPYCKYCDFDEDYQKPVICKFHMKFFKKYHSQTLQSLIRKVEILGKIYGECEEIRDYHEAIDDVIKLIREEV